VLNLAADPAYAADLERLRGALDHWQQTYGDLGLIPEEELIERWRPGGVHQVTASPTLELVDGRIQATCPTEGASIAWTSDEPKAVEPETPFARVMSGIMGSPQADGRKWQLYTTPVAAEGHTIWFRACRLGYEDSADVPFTP
jgi:N-sulfoglucosamine sulfohydrolase